MADQDEARPNEFNPLRAAACRDDPMPEFHVPPKVDLYEDMRAEGAGGLFSDDKRLAHIGPLTWQKENSKLFAYFGIDEGHPRAWEALALTLAFRYVPGFDPRAPVKRSGRPREWGPAEDAVVYSWIEMKRRQQPDRTKTFWFRNFSKPLASLLGGSVSQTKARDAYYRAENAPEIVEWERSQRQIFGEDWTSEMAQQKIVINWKLSYFYQRALPILRRVDAAGLSENNQSG